MTPSRPPKKRSSEPKAISKPPPSIWNFLLSSSALAAARDCSISTPSTSCSMRPSRSAGWRRCSEICCFVSFLTCSNGESSGTSSADAMMVCNSSDSHHLSTVQPPLLPQSKSSSVSSLGPSSTTGLGFGFLIADLPPVLSGPLSAGRACTNDSLEAAAAVDFDDFTSGGAVLGAFPSGEPDSLEAEGRSDTLGAALAF